MGFLYETKGRNLWKEILDTRRVALRYDVNKTCHPLT